MKTRTYEINTRYTGMGAHTDAVVFVPGYQNDIAPDFEESSKSGNHGFKRWDDVPAEAIIDEVDITNSGKVYGTRSCSGHSHSYHGGRWDLPLEEGIPFKFNL